MIGCSHAWQRTSITAGLARRLLRYELEYPTSSFPSAPTSPFGEGEWRNWAWDHPLSRSSG